MPIEHIQSRFSKILESSLPQNTGRSITRQLSHILDFYIIELFQNLQKELHISDRICIIAVGGYGRLEICPFSDIDLLYLHNDLPDRVLEKIISKINTFLYDNGREVGHACRTIDESKIYLDNLESFHTILDARYLIGSDKLYQRFEREVLQRLPENLIAKFDTIKLNHLKHISHKFEKPLVVSEPNIKTESFFLRDIQYVYWLEQEISQKNRTRNDSRNWAEDFESLGSAYDFFLKTRVALHSIAKRKQDRLDLALQGEVAEYLGFGPKEKLSSVEKLMHTLFNHNRNVYLFFGAFVENRDLPNIDYKLETIELDTKKFQTDGKYLYIPKYEPLFTNPETLYADILQTFSFCQKKGIEPSRLLLRNLKSASQFLDADFPKNPNAVKLFYEIILEKKNVGLYLTLMHESGILGKFLPEFGASTNFSLFSYHHQYPVDEHSLLIARELDSILNESFEDPEIVELAKQTEFVHVLYLVILIHDAGKVKEGDHCQYGAELARVVAERIGLSQTETELFYFLVLYHIEMSELTTKRDIYDPNLIEQFGNLVESQNTLNLLYILTIIDTKSVGAGILTGWKRSILLSLFRVTTDYLQNENSQASLESKQELETNQLSVFLQQKEYLDESIVKHIVDFTKRVEPKSYLSSTTPRRILSHFREIAMVNMGNKKLSFLWEKEPTFVTVTIITKFSKNLLIIISGLFFSRAINLVGMRCFRTNENDFISEVQITDSNGNGNISDDILERIQESFVTILEKESEMEEILQNQYAPQYSKKFPQGLVSEKVEINNITHKQYSILEVRLPDSIGLFNRLLRVLFQFDLEVHFLRISTSADYAYDTFYITDVDGKKLEDEEKISELRKEILAVAFPTEVMPTRIEF